MHSVHFFCGWSLWMFCCQPIQTSLVLLIFLRLVEDVMMLQTVVPTQRRRDILTALTAVMPSLFPCFVHTLRTSLDLYCTKVKLPCRFWILRAVLTCLLMVHWSVFLLLWGVITLTQMSIYLCLSVIKMTQARITRSSLSALWRALGSTLLQDL